MTREYTMVNRRLQPRPVVGRLLQSWARRLLLSRLQRLREGAIVLCDGPERLRFGMTTPDFPDAVQVHILDPGCYTDIAFGGSVGAGEAWMSRCWDTPDLTTLVRIMVRNMDVLDSVEGGFARIVAPALRLRHWLRRNTVSGARRNIAAHYDLGNDFFSLFLDPRMMYSSAVFAQEGMSLAEASTAKLEGICRKLELRPGDHVLEIGTGWGGFAEFAASRYGCRVTTATISRAQHAYAVERIRHAGLAHLVNVVLRDYRELSGSYDKLVCIEMMEAVGHRYFDVFLRSCADLLRRDGLMLLQVITIADQRFESARRAVDFIQRHIFPGGALPSVAALTASLARSTDFRVLHLSDIGLHYATTLRHWRAAFEERIDRVRALGYPDRFVRMWLFYLCYCEGGFLERNTGTVQVLLGRPGCRRAPL